MWWEFKRLRQIRTYPLLFSNRTHHVNLLPTNGTALAAMLTLGDHQYEKGMLADFQQVYDRSWGAFRTKTRPAVGNHEYLITNAAGYFDYFGAAAGDRTKGYYTTTVGDWRLYTINSNCDTVGGCGVGSPQYEWLKRALAQNPRCSLAYWHYPRYSSSMYGANSSIDAIWDLLYRNRVELVLASHAHQYERFNRINDQGSWAADGIRSFVVGTGGKSLYGWGIIDSRSATRYNGGFGALKLKLRSDGYSWAFVSEAGKTYSDSGSGTCATVPTSMSGGAARESDPSTTDPASEPSATEPRDEDNVVYPPIDDSLSPMPPQIMPDHESETHP